MSDDDSDRTQFFVKAKSGNRILDQPVVVEAIDAESAKQTVEDELDVFEIKVRTFPYEGTTWETVLSRSEEIAAEIATARSGEYSEVPEETTQWETDLEVVEATPVESLDTREAEHAADEHRHAKQLRDQSRN